VGCATRFVVTSLPLLPRTPPAGATGRRADPMALLLRQLIGRQLRVLVGRIELSGKLVTADPVVLVTAQGRAAMVRTEAIVSVEY
jgi:hypothetical protein